MTTIGKHSFKDLLQQSLKSNDTEEWIDIYFTRPIGLIFALFWIKLGVRPNAITILSIFLGVASGFMFYHSDLWHNAAGILLLMLANFCDSTDGQMARLTGDKTLIGRMLDGFAGDVWFFAIYLAIALRLWNEPMPFINHHWGIWALILVIVAGVKFHSPQSSLSDYYRQIHLLFLKGRSGSELDTAEKQDETYRNLPQRGAFWDKIFYYNYRAYCKSQERRTPKFQQLYKNLLKKYGDIDSVPQDLKNEFLDGSRPLMPITNILTFNIRALTIYITCLADCPWVYPLTEITLLQALYINMHSRHENLCQRLFEKENLSLKQ